MMNKQTSNTHPALILAAGRSERMGAPKLLIESNGLPVFVEMILGLQKAGWDEASIIVSDRELTDRIRAHFPDLMILYNDRPEMGMISSIRIWLRWADRQEGSGYRRNVNQGVLCWPVDHPLVSTETLAAMRKAAFKSNVTLPVTQGRRGHPTWWGRSNWKLLRSRAANQGANLLLRSGQLVITEVEVEDEGVLANINTPGDAEVYGLSIII